MLAFGKFPHVDSHVVGFEDFLADDSLDDILHGENPRDGTEFVDHDGKLTMLGQEESERLVRRGVFRDEDGIQG